jgi:hypothetical protein
MIAQEKKKPRSKKKEKKRRNKNKQHTHTHVYILNTIQSLHSFFVDPEKVKKKDENSVHIIGNSSTSIAC